MKPSQHIQAYLAYRQSYAVAYTFSCSTTNQPTVSIALCSDARYRKELGQQWAESRSGTQSTRDSDADEHAFETYTIAAGTRFKLHHGRAIPVVDASNEVNIFNIEEKLAAARLAMQNFFHSSNHLNNHFCTLDCLQQPALTQVNQQIRGETLQIFYAINRFHVEMGNFHLNDHYTYRAEFRSPADWWRAIGDINLRLIHDFTLMAHRKHDRMKGVEVRVLRKPQAQLRNQSRIPATITNTESALKQALGYRNSRPPTGTRPVKGCIPYAPRDPNVLRKRSPRAKDVEDAVAPYVKTMRESGLHVRVLECMLADLEPWAVRYLRDYEALA